MLSFQSEGNERELRLCEFPFTTCFTQFLLAFKPNLDLSLNPKCQTAPNQCTIHVQIRSPKLRAEYKLTDELDFELVPVPTWIHIYRPRIMAIIYSLAFI
jgi:hypothetical protein